MSLTFAELVTEVQAYVGHGSDAAGALVGATRVGRYVNWAINRIVRDWPGLRDVHTIDRVTLKCQANIWEYYLNAYEEKPVAHIIKLRYIRPDNTDYNIIKPYVGGLDAFDRDIPYIPDLGTGIPEVYVRRGNRIEIAPMPGANEAETPLWLEYSYLPGTIATTTEPVITDFDEVIIAYTLVRVLRVLGKNQESVEQMQVARLLAAERVESESDWDESDVMPYDGP